MLYNMYGVSSSMKRSPRGGADLPVEEKVRIERVDGLSRIEALRSLLTEGQQAHSKTVIVRVSGIKLPSYSQ